MKFRKVVLLFMILGFGVVIEGISVTRSVSYNLIWNANEAPPQTA